MSKINPSELRDLKWAEWRPFWDVERPAPNGNAAGVTAGYNYFFVPYWLVTALKRANLGYRDIYSYKKIREVLPPVDIARLLQCQNMELGHLKKFTEYSGGYWSLFSHWSSECSDNPVLHTELHELIRPLYYDKSGVAAIKEYLYADKNSNGSLDTVVDGDSKISKIFHNVVVLDKDSIAIVVEKGFLTAIEDRAYALRFVSDYLKAQYGIAPISSVSYDAAFADYVGLL